MSDNNIRPNIIGREEELNKLKLYLKKTAKGQCNTVFISGEAGIGKTRIVNELKQIAQSKNFQILSGNSMYESLTPFMPIIEALRSVGLDHLFTEESPRVEAVYLVTPGGLLIKEVMREDTELRPDIFAAMLTAVGNFVKESLSILSGEEKEGQLNVLGYENYKILIESGRNGNLVVLLTGKENEFLINDMKEILLKIHRNYGNVLEDWDGDDKKVIGIETIIKLLITSGKFDGIYYGKEDPKSRRSLLFENVSMGLMRYVQTSPTILCLEDLQWADPSTLSLMHYLARSTRNCGLLIIGTYRPEDISLKEGENHPLVGTLQMIDHENLFKEMNLHRFSKENMSKFLSSLLGSYNFNDQFKNRIFKETEGNPLFIIELIRLMIGEKIITKENKIWKLSKEFKDIKIPSKIYNVIIRRLNRLEKEDRKILDYASIIGELFNSSILATSLNIKRLQLLERLRDLEQTHRLIHSSIDEFNFDHSKIKEIIYNEIPVELKIEYHSVIANSIETLNKNNLDEVIGDLAFHYYRSKNKDKALFYLFKAAEKAKNNYSNEEAILLYNQSLEMEKDAHKRMKINENIGDIQETIGDYDKSIKSYKNALTLAEEKKMMAEIRTKIGYIFYKKGEFDTSINICNESLNLVRGMDCKEEAFTLDKIGLSYSRKGDYKKAFDYYKRSVEIKKKIDDKKGIAEYFWNMGVLLWITGKFDKALKYFKNSLTMGERINDLEHIGDCYNCIGSIYCEKGEYDKSLEYFWEGNRRFEKIGSLRGLGYILGNSGYCYIGKGEYDEAISHLENSLMISKKINNRVSTGWNYCGMAEAYLKKRDSKRALDICRKAFDISNEIGFKRMTGRSKLIMGMIYRDEKKWKLSIENFNESIKIFTTLGIEYDLSDSLYEFGLMWRDKGDTDSAKVHLNNAYKIFKKLKIDKKMEIVRSVLDTL